MSGMITDPAAILANLNKEVQDVLFTMAACNLFESFNYRTLASQLTGMPIDEIIEAHPENGALFVRTRGSIEGVSVQVEFKR